MFKLRLSGCLASLGLRMTNEIMEDIKSWIQDCLEVICKDFMVVELLNSQKLLGI